MGEVPEWRKIRWKGRKRHHVRMRRIMQKRRRKVAELWFTGQFGRKELALLMGCSYSTIKNDIRAIMEEIEKGSVCFLCGGTVHKLPNIKVLKQTAAAHRRLADILEGKG